jgi:methylmalonyl-CoA mutase N-terminal domain/subunit
MWANIMTERFGAKDPKSTMLRFHTQTGGATLTAQQPENNIVRTALEALSAVLGGTQSLHTNSFDEALALPTERSAKIALRTQQIIGYETGVAAVADPAGGSYFVEALTDELERLATALIEKVDGMGGAVAAIEAGFYQGEIHEAAFRVQRGIEDGSRVIVGVNRFQDETERAPELQRIDETGTTAQIERTKALRASRDVGAVEAALAEVRTTSTGTGNLLPPMKEALRARATLGEVSDVLREVFGEYRPTS